MGPLLKSHLSSKTGGHLLDCPSHTQMFRLPSAAAVPPPTPHPRLLIPPECWHDRSRNIFSKTEPRRSSVQLCLNICSSLSSSGKKQGEKSSARDGVTHAKPGPRAAAAATAQTIIRLASCDLAHGAQRKLSADLRIINCFSWLEQVDVTLF